jgi:HD-GYP domain-containing protein (c-di-GMP phosphodiesterase class II)
MPRRVYVYVSLLAVVAIAMIGTISRTWPQPSRADWLAAAVFAGLGLFAQRLNYRTNSNTVGSVGFVSWLSLGAIAPNFASISALVAVLTITEFTIKREMVKRVFNISQHAITFAVGLAVFRAAGGVSLLLTRDTMLIPFAAYYATTKLGNKLFVAGVISLSTRSPFERELNKQLPVLVYDTLALPMAYLFALAFARFGPFWAALMLVPMLALRAIYKTNADLTRNNEEMLQLMVAAIEARDPYTSGHSRRVSRYAEIIATTAAMPEKQVERIAMAALMHDVGKIHEVFAPILRKPERLTPEESLVMQTHSERGADLVAKVSSFADLVKPVLHHHERWDGQGYPQGLAGDEIPISARVINLADTIDAMTTDRPYRKALGADVVLREIQDKSGTQFDAALVDSLRHPTSWRMLCDALEDERHRALTPAEPKTMFITGPRRIPAQ